MDLLNLLWSQRYFFIQLIIQHLSISLTAILIATILGVGIGLFAAFYKKSSNLVLGVVSILYTIPSISMLGFLMSFFGIGDKTAIIALSIYGLLPMVKNTYHGITSIDENIIDAAKGMGSTNWQILTKIQLPLALPSIISGIRETAVMTIALAGIASFIGAGGLGVAIYRGITTNNVTMTLAGSILNALLALIIDYLIFIIAKFYDKYKRNKKVKLVSLGLVILTLGGVIISSIIPKASNDTITIATKPMSESYILGEMTSLVIEEKTGLPTKIVHGVGGGTSNIKIGMENGEFDIYPEYSGTAWSDVMGNDGNYSEDNFDQIQTYYTSNLNMSWIGMYGFEDKYSIAVNKDIAQQYNLKTFSDLARVSSNLTFGAEPDFFEREDGYKALNEAYHFNFKKTADFDIGLKYNAMNNNEVDAMVVFTTDGKLPSSNTVVLEDDKHVFSNYYCGNVVRNEVIDKHPEVKDSLLSLTGCLDEETMAQLNYQVEVLQQDPRDVARNYLQQKGII